MSFKYACFISYRNGDRQRDNVYIFKLVEELKKDLLNELELLLEPEERDIFLDTEGLQGGDFLYPRIAQALCRSVCMICLWTPIYFSRTHNYCAREYRAMEILEEHRKRLLRTSSNSTQGLIIPLALRECNRFPCQLNRLYVNFEDFLQPTERGKLTKPRGYFKKIKELAKYVAQRYQELKNLSTDSFKFCDTFELPQADAQEFIEWLDLIIENNN